MAEELLDFSKPVNTRLLDQICHLQLHGNLTEIKQADDIMNKFKDHPQAWMTVDTIIEHSETQEAKYFALSVLEPVVKYKWNALPEQQRQGIKQFIVQKIINLSTTEESLRNQKILLDKLNITLVQIIKKEWPAGWSGLIKEIVTASGTSETICENNMIILTLLSEEIFDFSKGEMTTAKINELKSTFNNEFLLIFKLCEYILGNSHKISLLKTTLRALLGFLSWIPIGYIFETSMVKGLIERFLGAAEFRNITLKCLIEVAGLNVGDVYDNHFSQLLTMFLQVLSSFLPVTINIAAVYENANESDKDFVHDLALFFTTFFRNHRKVVDQLPHREVLLGGHLYLANITRVDDEETFKICLEYWNSLAAELYHETPVISQGILMLSDNSGPTTPRRELYANILSKVRFALISKMAKPEEVLIVEDDLGNVIREMYKDSQTILLYKQQRETLVYLTHLDYQDTIDIMQNKLTKITTGEEWTRQNLNTLCWAVGSISGVQSELQEKKFLVKVIQDLLKMCEDTEGKDNKAVIASNIMYVVGQYPRFLQSHWKFLKTVVVKLFEFMHEKHPGVQDMAVDTFLKIAKSCRKEFVIVQQNEQEPYIYDILKKILTTIKDLEELQIQTFYEACGYMINSAADSNFRKNLIQEYMRLPNEKWRNIIAEASSNIAVLQDPATAKTLGNILKINVRAASSLRHNYISQMGNIFMELMHVYAAYSQAVNEAVAAKGTGAINLVAVKHYRTVKQETLRLVSEFIKHTKDVGILRETFLKPLFETVLLDYQQNIPNAKDAQVLALMTTIINKLKRDILDAVPRIMAAVFECTLVILTQLEVDYPDHRMEFYNFLRALNQHCFPAFFHIPPQLFKSVIDSIIYGIKNQKRDVSDIALSILGELWENITNSEVSDAFYKTYLLLIVQELFFVLTDTMHKSGFKMQATILLNIFRSVEIGQVKVQLWEQSQGNYSNNQEFLRHFVLTFLSKMFPNLSTQQHVQFVNNLFKYCNDLPLFKQTLRDFLVQSKEFTGKDNSELFREEIEEKEREVRSRQSAVPGLIRQEVSLDQMDG